MTRLTINGEIANFVIGKGNKVCVIIGDKIHRYDSKSFKYYNNEDFDKVFSYSGLIVGSNTIRVISTNPLRIRVYKNAEPLIDLSPYDILSFFYLNNEKINEKAKSVINKIRGKFLDDLNRIMEKKSLREPLRFKVINNKKKVHLTIQCDKERCMVDIQKCSFCPLNSNLDKKDKFLIICRY